MRLWSGRDAERAAHRFGEAALLGEDEAPRLRDAASTRPARAGAAQARVCYDHLAGELGVFAYDALRARGALDENDEGVYLTNAGACWFGEFGIDPAAVAAGRRAFCRPCLDWGERRHHLGGGLGAALLDRVLQLRWASRTEKGSRVIAFTARGEAAFRAGLAA